MLILKNSTTYEEQCHTIMKFEALSLYQQEQQEQHHHHQQQQ